MLLAERAREREMVVMVMSRVEQLLVLEAIIILITMPWNHHLAVQASLAKPNCPQKCGNISIPFPFGTEPGCFLDRRYEMQCKQELNKPTLRMSKHGFEVTGISLTDQTITFTYLIDVMNMFFQDNKSSPSDRAHDLEVFAIGQDWAGNSETLPVSITLNWKLACSQATAVMNRVWKRYNYSSNPTRECDSSSTTCYCKCNPGYGGNPYLAEECEDINECEDESIKRSCPHCQNLRGSYICGPGPDPVATGWNGNRIVDGIGSGFGALVSFLFGWRLRKVVKKRRKMKIKKINFRRNGGLLLQQHLSSPETNVEKNKLFDSKELEKATNHFNNDRIIGRGGQGTVYKGMLSDGRIVAVKKSKSIDKGNIKNFINEVFILANINHRNVVKLLGCCLEMEVPLLVYEYVPNGTLFRYIHDPNEEFQLTWEVRLQIATEVASALSYLHSAASIPIYHRDIKSTNILLDDKYRAKVADFGISKLVALDETHLTTQVQGTFGYLDPEYFQSSRFSDKSDVYSFGIVLVELLSGQKPISSLESNEKMCRGLAAYFIECMNEDQLFDIVDHRVSSQEKREEIMAFANLARKCLCLNGKKRPTMKQVASEIESIRKISQQHSKGHENQDDRDHECLESEDTEKLDIALTTSFRSEMTINIIPSLENAKPLINTW